MIKNTITKLFTSVIAIAILMPALAFGATLKAGEEVLIKKGDIRDNLYVAGGNISISSAVFGDLLVAGGNILISENVSEDITVVGGAITILGDSGGDMRVAGGNILISGDIFGELVVAGGSVTISSDVSIKEDLVIYAGQVLLEGEVLGDTEITGGIITINGHIKGNVKAKIDEKLTLGDAAFIEGDLEYSARSAEALKVSEGAIITGETLFNEIDAQKADGAKNFIFEALGAFVLFKVIALTITALILVWLFKDFSYSVIRSVIKSPLRMLGRGFIVLVVIPAASIILFITLFGIPLGLIAMLSYGLLVLITSAYAGVVAGAWVIQLIRKSDRAVITWKTVVGGVVLLAIVGFIPFIGWIIGLFVFLVTLGSITDLVHKKLWKER